MADDKPKVPTQFFSWFDSLKQSYDDSVNKLLGRFEAIQSEQSKNMSHIHERSLETIEVNHSQHLDSLSKSHQDKVDTLTQQLHFYQTQVTQQQAIIEKMNARYDAVIMALQDKLQDPNLMRDITPTVEKVGNSVEEAVATETELSDEQDTKLEQNIPDSIENEDSTDIKEDLSTEEQPTEDLAVSKANLLSKAKTFRAEGEFVKAVTFYELAAQKMCEQSMGALGRAFFIGEGVAKDKELGMAWLICSAKHGFQPAIKKVNQAKEANNDFYQRCERKSDELLLG